MVGAVFRHAADMLATAAVDAVEAIGELGATVGQDGVDREREALEKARQEGRGGGGPAIGEDFEIDKADRDLG